MFKFEIEPGLALKPLELGDANALYEMIDKSREHLRTYLHFVDMTKSAADTKAFVEQTVRSNAEQNTFVAVILVDDQVAGLVGYNQINWTNQNAEIGYWLGAPFVRKGVMSKATRVLVDYGFNHFGLNRIELRAAKENLASRGVAEKLNFVYEGTKRQCEWVNDRFVDHVIYGMLKSEWKMNEKVGVE